MLGSQKGKRYLQDQQSLSPEDPGRGALRQMETVSFICVTMLIIRT